MPGSSEETLNSIMVRIDGPLIARGNIEILDTTGKVIYQGGDIALCRCGASKNKPFCDGSHKDNGFVDDGQFSDQKAEAPEGTGKLVIQCRANAMLLAKGPRKIHSRDGNSETTRNKAALCRCGVSENKPFCDAKHKQCGFSAE
jgi:CDGSH-type Zn-finger protein